MYNIGDLVLYGGEGICKIKCIEEKKIADRVIKYYVLTPEGISNSVFYVPMEGKTAEEKIRKIISGKEIKENAIHEIEVTEDLKMLNDLRVKYLGKKGELTSILRGMGGLSPEERPIIGAEVNKAKEEVENLKTQKRPLLTSPKGGTQSQTYKLKNSKT